MKSIHFRIRLISAPLLFAGMMLWDNPLALAASDPQIATPVADAANWLQMLQIFLMILLLVSVTLAIWQLVKLRRIQSARLETENGLLVFPEAYHDELSRLSESVASHLAHGRQNIEEVKKNAEQLARSISEAQKQTIDVISTFHEELSTKNHELERFRNGYDAYLLDGLITKLARIRGFFVDELKDADGECTRLLGDLLRLVDNALEGSGVERFEPAIGSLFTEASGVDSRHRIVDTHDKSLHGRIARIDMPGLRVASTLPGTRPPIREANVAVYRFVPTPSLAADGEDQ